MYRLIISGCKNTGTPPEHGPMKGQRRARAEGVKVPFSAVFYGFYS